MKKGLSFIITTAMLASSCIGFYCTEASAENEAPGLAVSSASARQVEYLERGLVAIRVTGGVYLSWRLLGTEPLTQTFDIYRDGVKIQSGLDAVNYVDNEGFSYNVYQVVPAGVDRIDLYCDKTEVLQNNYIDIPIDKPAGGTTKAGESYTYSANDVSVIDVDGDGEYEYILKWDPSNSKDNSYHGQTGNVLLDCYKQDGTRLWRIDLGINIRAGAHYTQFIAYDFDGDGKGEVAMRTAPGSKDSTGKYVSRVGADIGNDKFSFADSSTGTTYKDTDDLRQGGSKSGHIIKGPDWLTMFNGETGEAMQTVMYPIQRGSVKSWGDSYGGRSERYLAGVAYLDGVKPSLIMCRGYYAKAGMGAYNWNGSTFTKLWSRTDSSDKSTLYTNGNHQLSVADADNDGKDEIIWGSAIVDDNGTMLNATGHGHGDALHVSDFNNDGNQQVFTVHEEKTYYKTWGAELRNAGTNTITAYTKANGDNGRGVMANIDDDYAYANGFHSYYWSVADSNLYRDDGTDTGKAVALTSIVDSKPTTTNVYQPSSCNSLIYWDGDLSRELLDRNRIDKYSVENGQSRLATFDNVHTNNSTKSNASLSADLFGDWREEVMFPTADDAALRIFMTTEPTEYKLTTLMHDTQYRCAIAWQNVGYNQPPHPSYYIGKDALAKSKNYLAPKTQFDTVKYASIPEKNIETPDEEMTLIASSDSFDNGNWDIGTKGKEAQPYNNIVTTSTGTETKTLEQSLWHTDEEIKSVTLKSFTLGEKKAEAVIKNEMDQPFAAKLYAAVYSSDNTIYELHMTDISVSGGEEKNAEVLIGAIPSGGRVMAFLWDQNQKALTEALTADNPSIENRTLDSSSGMAETIKFALDWKPAASDNSVSILNESSDNLITISKKSSSAVQYAAGASSAKTVNSTLTGSGSWYHLELIMDMTAKTADISVLDYTASGSTVKMVYAASFAGVDGMPGAIKVKGKTLLDNINISTVKYNVKRSLVKFNVKDANGSTVKDCRISIGGTTLTTDDNGSSAIKVKNGEYSYTVSKAEYKTAKDTINVTEESEIDAVLQNGELRNIYVKYMFDNAVDISGSVPGSEKPVGEAIENSVYTLPDSAKQDITGYTFPSEEDDIVPGYEDLAGKTYNLEFDPDKSEVTNVTIGEDSDTTIVISYKIKRVPADADKSLLSIQYGEGGIGSDRKAWSVTNNAYEQMSDSGKYIRISNLGDSTLTVNIPNTSKDLVMEFDMKYEDMPWGGNYFGLTPYSGNSAGQGFGMRTSGESNGQWQLCYRAGKDQYVTTTSSDKAYSYSYNWKNQWMHMVVVCDGTQLKVTQANKDTGRVFIQDGVIPLANNVGSASKPINKIVFGRTYGSGNAVIGFKNFKAYTVGASDDYSESTKQIDVPSTTAFTASAMHPSDMEGVFYDASAFMGKISYELRDTDGNPAEPEGLTLDENGVLTAAASFDTGKQYKVVVMLDGKDWYGYALTYRIKTLTTGTFKGFGSAGDLGNFSLTKASGYSLVNNGDGTLKYARTAGTAVNNSVYLTFPVTSSKLEDEFYFAFDMKIVSAAFKGYMFLRNNASGDEYIRAETHLYTPRIKFFTDGTNTSEQSFNSSKGFTMGNWYTFVYHGTDMSNSSRKLMLDIYKTADLALNNRNYSSINATPVFSIEIKPNQLDTSKGLYFAWQVAQNLGSGNADNADEWYFDNVYYQYYAFN